MGKILIHLWNYLKSAFSEGLVEGIKGLLTGGSVGAITDSWRGFLIGMFVGSLLGAFVGSSLGKFFDFLLESIHLLFNVRKIHFKLELNNISPEIGENLKPNYLLVRYGIDEVVQLTAKSKQDILATRLRNKEIKIVKEYNAEKRKLILNCILKKHVIFGTQFKLYMTGVPFSVLKAALNEVPYIKEITSGSGNLNKTYVLLNDKTLVSNTKKNKNYSIAEVKSIEGIPNNFIYPK